MDIIVSGTQQSDASFEKKKEFSSIAEVRSYVSGWALRNRITYYSKSSCPKEFQAVCPEVRNMTKKEVEVEKKCPFYISAYRRRNAACIKFTKDCVTEHHKSCTARRRRVTAMSLKEYVKPLCNFMRDMDPQHAIDVTREKYGMSVPYYIHAECSIKADALFVHDDSIQYLHNYLLKVQEVNPGTVISFQTFESVFFRAFLCPAVSSKAFSHLLPVVAIDACHMRTKQGGMIFSATGTSSQPLFISELL